MNYKLAKRLKDAGFPQKLASMVSNPPLEALIEACGKDFKELSYDETSLMWFASSYSGLEVENAEQKNKDIEGCKTPAEAVAELWLLLNK